MLSKLFALWTKPAPIETPEAFIGFLTRHAAFTAQKATIEYCRARAGAHWEKLVHEGPFRDGLERCRWDAFAAVLSDAFVIGDGYLRSRAEMSAGLDPAYLTRGYADALNAYPLPDHRPNGWGDATAAFEARLARARLAEPKRVVDVAEDSGNRVFDLLPIHPSLRREDRPMVRNCVRFNLCRMYEDMERTARPAAIVAAALETTCR